MLHFTLILCDTLIVSTRSNVSWETTITDALTGKTVKKSFSDAEIGAILALAVGGEEYDFTKELYNIAEPAMKDIPTECRLIP